MSKIVYIFFVLYGLLPLRLIAIGNVDPFTFGIFLVYLPAFAQGIQWARSPENDFSAPSRYIGLVLLALLISYLHMILDIGLATSWIPIWVSNYMLFWVFLREVNSLEKIRQLFSWLVALNLVGIVFMAYFFLNPSILEGPLRDAGMGSFRGYMGDIPRVFTPAMAYVALGAMYGLSYLVYARHRGRRLAALAFVVVSVLSIGVFTSVRSYLLAIVVGGVVLLLARLSWVVLARTIVWGTVALVLLLVLLPGVYVDYFSERFGDPISSTEELTLDDAEVMEQGAYSTMYWRLLDASIALELVETPGQVLFGRMGHKYDVPGVEDALAPHISIVGIYYLFGAVGVVLLLSFGVFFTRHIIGVVRLYREREDFYIAAFLLSSWVMLFVISVVGGGVYYAPECAAAASVCALSVILRQSALGSSGGL